MFGEIVSLHRIVRVWSLRPVHDRLTFSGTMGVYIFKRVMISFFYGYVF